MSEPYMIEPTRIPLGFTPRYRMTRVFGPLQWTREVSRQRFFDELINRGLLVPSTNPEDATVLFGSGLSMRAPTLFGAILFTVRKA